MSYSVEYNFLWTVFSPRKLFELFVRGVLGDLVHQLWVWREWLLALFRRLFLDTDSATLVTEPSLSSLSLPCNGFPRHAFFAFSLKSKITNEKRAKQRIQNTVSSVLACGLREVRDIMVRIVDGRRVNIHGSDLVELFGLITCEEDGRGQVDKLLVLVRSALDPRFWAGKVRQDRVDGCVGEVGLEVTVQKQQTETGETWEKSRETTCACNKHLFHDLEPRVCDTHEDVRSTQWARCAQKVCEQHVSVCTPVVAHKVAVSTWVWNFTPWRNSSLHDHLGRTPSDFLLGPFDLSHQDLIHKFAFHQVSDVWVNASRFPEACSSCDSWWWLCVEFWIWVLVHSEVSFPIVWERVHFLLYFLEYHVSLCKELLKFCRMQLAIACFMNFLHGLLTQNVVLVAIPRSTNCDSLTELGRSLTFANLISVLQGLRKMSEFLFAPKFSECYFWSFRGTSCLANNYCVRFYW